MVGNLVLIHSNVVVSAFKKYVISPNRFSPLLDMKLNYQLHQASTETTKQFDHYNFTKVTPVL